MTHKRPNIPEDKMTERDERNIEALSKVAEGRMRAQDAEIARWQERIRAEVIKRCGASDADIDGGGCESGDPLDFTISEIMQGIGVMEDRLQTRVKELEDQNSQMEVQLAGVAVAALGGTKEPATRGMYGWSPAYQDVLDLRLLTDGLVAEAESTLQFYRERGRVVVENDGNPIQRLSASAEIAVCKLETKLNGLAGALKESNGTLIEVVKTWGGWHDEGCPCDDTCECSQKPMNDRINNSIEQANAALAAVGKGKE